MQNNPLKQLGTLGQSIWLDYIRRDLIAGAARPSGTGDIYKISAESFRGADHRILEEAQAIVRDTLAATPDLTQKPEHEAVEYRRSEKNPHGCIRGSGPRNM